LFAFEADTVAGLERRFEQRADRLRGHTLADELSAVRAGPGRAGRRG
jgi:hypothetical protein